MTASDIVSEAQRIASRAVREENKQHGKIERALEKVAEFTGLPLGALRTLWRRRSVKSVDGGVFETLKRLDEWLDVRAECELAILEETARRLEEAGHPCAGIARSAADLARGQ